MPIGAGRYDDVTTLVREETNAEGVIVIVFSGNKGHGFSCQFTSADLVGKMPSVLRDVANGIEESLKEGRL